MCGYFESHQSALKECSSVIRDRNVPSERLRLLKKLTNQFLKGVDWKKDHNPAVQHSPALGIIKAPFPGKPSLILKQHQQLAVRFMYHVETSIPVPQFVADDVWDGVDFEYEMTTWFRHNPVCKINGGVIADEQGLGKTTTMAAIIQLHPPCKTEPRNVCLIPSPVTLVICPSQITDQWERELGDKMPDRRIFVANTHKDLAELSYDELSHHTPNRVDILIVSHKLFLRRSPLYKKDDSYLVQKKPGSFPTDVKGNVQLTSLHFFRIIYDEGHEFVKQRTIYARGHLDAEWVWYVSGTPFPRTHYYKNLIHLFNPVEKEPRSQWVYLNHNPRPAVLLKFVEMLMTRRYWRSTNSTTKSFDARNIVLKPHPVYLHPARYIVYKLAESVPLTKKGLHDALRPGLSRWTRYMGSLDVGESYKNEANAHLFFMLEEAKESVSYPNQKETEIQSALGHLVRSISGNILVPGPSWEDLKYADIPFVTCKGSVEHRREAIRAFKSRETRVMFVNYNDSPSGIDGLPIEHIVFTRPPPGSVEEMFTKTAQSISRAVRMNSASNTQLTVHVLFTSDTVEESDYEDNPIFSQIPTTTL